MENYDKECWNDKKCPPINCKKKTCECGLEKVFLPAVLGDDSKDSPIAPKNGAYCDAIVVYEANKHIYIYSKDGIPTLITSGGGGDYDEIIKEIQEDLAKTEGDLAKEVLDRTAGDKTLQDEIDEMKNSPDVVDIVASYSALVAYDTSKLGDNDIIRVLQDEMHEDQSTYYRWNKQNSTWIYIGTVGDYYTKGQVDTLLADKQDELTAGSNISITQVDDDLVISATDTTYSNFVGTDGVSAGTAGLVPAPLTTDAGKFLKADGTWDTAGGGGPTVVQTTGTSQTDVMSQNAVSELLFNDTSTRQNVQIGNRSSANGAKSIAIGSEAKTNNNVQAISIGSEAKSSDAYSTAIGSHADAGYYGVALGAWAKTTRSGEVNIGTGTSASGYSGTSYRVLGGVYDGQNSHDAATVGQINATIDAINTALSTNIPHIGA